jgi:ubiquinone/menaquinone biosynthesis C-methylase UbiE/uncharacterized protein YbaR (Trm112 family)
MMNQVSLTCPTCRALLQAEAKQHTCPTCRRAYPHTLGIPDLCPPELTLSVTETALVKHLCEIYPQTTARELGLTRLSTLLSAFGYTAEEQRHTVIQYGLEKQTRGQQFCRTFQRALTRHLALPRPGLALDLGCGTGAGTVTLAADFEHVVGIDVSLSALLVAKKLIESEGLTNVTLIRCSALNLPLLDCIFDYCIAINVLEHIFDPTKMLQEVYRVLSAGGLFSGDSRNRFDPFFPEPHVKLRWVGFLPRKWMAAYVRWRKGIDYAHSHTHLLSYGDLARALRVSFGSEWRIALPDVSVYNISGAIGQFVEQLDRTTLLRPAFARISPSHWALARRVG